MTRTLDQVMEELAGLEAKCPSLFNGKPSLDHTDCPGCAGTGRVFVLEGVREPCSGSDFADCESGKVWGEPARDCPRCHGKGWVASHDSDAWWNAATKFLERIHVVAVEDRFMVESKHGNVGEGATVQEALVRMLAKALLKEKSQPGSSPSTPYLYPY